MKALRWIGLILIASCTHVAFARGMPPGSYWNSCTRISLRGETLSASCRRFDGSMDYTQLRFATSCVGIVSNVDGNLVCTAPTGSFARTCVNPRVAHHRLFAECQRRDGSWMRTETRFRGYQHPVSNCNGRLVDRPRCYP